MSEAIVPATEFVDESGEEPLYAFIRDDSSSWVVTQASLLMRRGWIPLGGVSIIQAHRDEQGEFVAPEFVQAFTRKHRPKPMVSTVALIGINEEKDDADRQV